MNTFISCVKYNTPSPFFLLPNLCTNCVFGELIKFHSVSFIDFTGGHIYHSQCLNAWIVSKQDRNEVPNCPMCRAEITQEDCTKVKHTFSIITHRREADAKQRKREKEATERKQLKKKQLERQTRLKQEKEERDKREEAHVLGLAEEAQRQAEEVANMVQLNKDQAEAKRKMQKKHDQEKAEKNKLSQAAQTEAKRKTQVKRDQEKSKQKKLSKAKRKKEKRKEKLELKSKRTLEKSADEKKQQIIKKFNWNHVYSSSDSNGLSSMRR